MVKIHNIQLQSQALSSVSGSSTQSVPSLIDETMIADEYDADRRYYDEQITYMSNALSTLLLGFRMSIRQTLTVPVVPPMALSPALPPQYWLQSPPPPSNPKEDEDATDLGS
ncbi:hypothetical protein PanWU01x14_293040 [Parasponia andersonii]|uniref:Uncharacterized protein n=1 Tax=Parasponia andersonii TaxID=3476 RepID=A0A2P5AWN7_PARAD|nr:hypothetical protein PanWU01x14_293040 [Parasponia andersonii]